MRTCPRQNSVKFGGKKKKINGGCRIRIFLEFFIIREHEKIIIGAGCEDSSGRGAGWACPYPGADIMPPGGGGEAKKMPHHQHSLSHIVEAIMV